MRIFEIMASDRIWSVSMLRELRDHLSVVKCRILGNRKTCIPITFAEQVDAVNRASFITILTNLIFLFWDRHPRVRVIAKNCSGIIPKWETKAIAPEP